MSLLPPAFKDPAFAPLGPPIKRRATFAQMREAYTKAQHRNALEDFESENFGNADTGCLQEPCMPPAGKEVIAHYSKAEQALSDSKWVCGEWGVDIGREGGDETAVAIRDPNNGVLSIRQVQLNRDVYAEQQAREMLDADVAHMRESKQITVSALLRAGQKLDANLAPPSPKLESALNAAQAAQAALAEHLFGEAKKVKDPFEKVTMKLRAKDAERAVQMKAKAEIMLQAACGAGQTATGMMLLQEAANRKLTPPKPRSLRDSCRDKMVELARRDMPLVTNVLRLFGAAGLVDIEDKYLPDLWDRLLLF